MENTTHEQLFIEAAAALDQRDPAGLDEWEAIYILVEYKGDARGDLFRELIREAAGQYFEDQRRVDAWEDVAKKWDGKRPEAVAFMLRSELMPYIRDEAERMQKGIQTSNYELVRIREEAAAAAKSGQERSAILDATLRDLKTIRDEIGEAGLLGMTNPATAIYEAVQEIIANQQAVAEALKRQARVSAEIMQSLEVWDQMRELVNSFAETTPLWDLYTWATGPELAPYLAEELKKPQYEGKSIKELWAETPTDEDGYFPDDSLIMQAIFEADAAFEEAGAGGAHRDIDAEAAREAAAITAAAEETEPAAGERPEEAAGANSETKQLLETIKYKRAQSITLSVGKGARRLFDPREWDRGRALAAKSRDEIPGQISFFPAPFKDMGAVVPVSYEREGNDAITLVCGMSADSFLQSINPEDFFILSFLDDAFVNGNTRVTPKWFYKEYYGDEPNPRQQMELYEKLDALAGTPIRVDYRQIVETWGTDEEKKRYKEVKNPVEPAAPVRLYGDIEETTEEIDGKKRTTKKLVSDEKRFTTRGGEAGAVIEILGRPSILQADFIAKQITTVPKSLLKVRDHKGRLIKKTPRFYRVLWYVLTRIAHIKSGGTNKILYSTLYEETGETTARGQQLAYKIALDIVYHFEREGWITGHKEVTTKSTGEKGLTFTWTDSAGRITSNGKKKRRGGGAAKSGKKDKTQPGTI